MIAPARRIVPLGTTVDHPYLRRFGKEQRLIDRLERRAVRKLLARIGGNGRLRVLDVPCGYGRLRAEWSDRADILVQADRSIAILEHAPAESSGGRVCCDIRHLPFRDRTFDLVCVIRLWHHLRTAEARAAVLGEVRRVGRNHVLISYYRRTPLHAWFRAVGRRFRRRVEIGMIEPDDFAREARAARLERLEEAIPLRGIHAQTLSLLAAREEP